MMISFYYQTLKHVLIYITLLQVKSYQPHLRYHFFSNYIEHEPFPQ